MEGLIQIWDWFWNQKGHVTIAKIVFFICAFLILVEKNKEKNKRIKLEKEIYEKKGA